MGPVELRDVKSLNNPLPEFPSDLSQCHHRALFEFGENREMDKLAHGSAPNESESDLIHQLRDAPRQLGGQRACYSTP